MNNCFYNVKDFGAIGDGKHNDSQNIQAAIDDCEQKGGGVFFFPSGIYLTGTIHLKSDIEYYIPSGTTILASKDMNLFDPYEKLGYESAADEETSYFHHAVFCGDEIHDIIIHGGGRLDSEKKKRHGPKPIAIKNSQQITIKDISIHNAMNYAISFGNSEYLTIDNISIYNAYADGIDLDSCRYARISNCKVESNDDGICLKGSLAFGEPIPCLHIVITNCTVATCCNAIKIGTETNGDFQNISISNCAIYPLPFTRAPTSGIALETVDGGNVDGIAIDNITMVGVKCPIFIRLGKRLRGMNPPNPGCLQNVIISNVVARSAHFPLIFAGLKEKAVNNIHCSNILVEYMYGLDSKGLKPVKSINIPENENNYPDPKIFGENLPMWAIYGRHFINSSFNNIKFNIGTEDFRPSIVLDDTYNLNFKDITINEINPKNLNADPLIWLENTKKLIIDNLNYNFIIQSLMKIDEKNCTEIEIRK